MDASFRRPGASDGEFILHRMNGSTCTDNDFLPIEEALPPGHRVALAPAGGRSSDGTLPFFTLAWPGGGVAAAVGWSGQWAASFQRDAGRLLRVRAGMQATRVALRPGEEIRTPRMLLVFWSGDDRLRGNNLLRRALLDRYVPRDANGPILPPVTANTWFTFGEGNGVNEANQLECLRRFAAAGVEAFWLDAGWFIGGWPSGVGSWSPRPEAFPRGLKPLGDAAREAGMGFVVWFEPERVSPGSAIFREHPAWVMRTGGGDGLFNLGLPEARAWLTDLLSRAIAESGITVYRNDFNIAPLPFWQKADAPDRQGMAEIRYVEGLYAMWGELRRRHPGLTIDTCASGGRRIDLEMLRLSYPLWHSDTPCDSRAHCTWDQNQTAGLSQYVPTHATGVWGFDPYTWRSAATAGAAICPDPRAPAFAAEEAKRRIAETKRLRPFWLGDFYPLGEIVKGEGAWCGWQLHREDRGAGMVQLFRREKSPYAALDAPLRGIDPDASYEVRHEDAGRTETLPGTALARLRVTIDRAPGCALITYRKK
jgi:alpha-galactosidase